MNMEERDIDEMKECEEHGSCGCGHSHSDLHCHCHDDDEEEMSLKKIIIAAVLFACGLLISHFGEKLAGALASEQASAVMQSLKAAENALSSLGGISGVSRILSIALYFFAYVLVGKNVVIGALKKVFGAKKGEHEHGEHEGHEHDEHGHAGHGKGWSAVFDEQFLMTVASLGAIFVGELPEAVGVMLFYQIGEWFQDYAVDKSRDSISALMKIRPDKAVVLRDGKEVSVDANDVEIEETIVVRPGERVPVDGEVVSGKSFIDNSALTGESVPLEVFVGNKVSSGAVNIDSVIQVRATKKSEDSAAARILKLVEESSEKKTKAERFITRFARVYTPIVCALALAVALLPPLALKFFAPALFAEYGWSVWIYRALIFLVVSCPCAIVISVPLTFFAGIGAAGKKGILVKGSGALDVLSKVKTVVFDKTGTLTKGVFVVTDVHPVEGKIQPDELIALAAHAETYSNHPVSNSLKQAHSKKECCSLVQLTDAQEISGQGIKVNLDGKIVLAGNQRLMENQGVNGFSECEKDGGGTVVHVAVDGEYYGHIVISDVTKEDSADAIKKLKKAGVKEIVMLTGDGEKAAQKTAAELGITRVFASLLPEDKVTKVEELLTGSNRAVAFAGDGINDAPVLARADVGIAMGAIGSDAAIESADVVIMNDSPALIADAVQNAKKTISIVKQNIVLSLGIKAVIMLLGALGIANMWIAVFGDTGVALIAVLNALRALRFKKSA